MKIVLTKSSRNAIIKTTKEMEVKSMNEMINWGARLEDLLREAGIDPEELEEN